MKYYVIEKGIIDLEGKPIIRLFKNKELLFRFLDRRINLLPYLKKEQLKREYYKNIVESIHNFKYTNYINLAHLRLIEPILDLQILTDKEFVNKVIVKQNF